MPSPGERPSQGIEPGSPELQGNTLPAERSGKPLQDHMVILFLVFKESTSCSLQGLVPFCPTLSLAFIIC